MSGRESSVGQSGQQVQTGGCDTRVRQYVWPGAGRVGGQTSQCEGN